MANEMILEQLYAKLPEYITQHLKLNVDTKGFFSCPTKKHNDADPSCHVFPRNTQVWKCFGCGSTGNIFTMANLKENLPIDGIEFWEVTVPHLCKMFNIPYDPVELDAATRERYQRYHAYKDAANIICTYPEDKPDATIYQYLADRGWSVETGKAMMLGVVESFDDYLKRMEELGWHKNYLMSIELCNKNILNKNNLIFIVTDDKNRPVGFAARNTKYVKPKKGEKGPKKYINSSTSDIYLKGDILYNMPNAKPFAPPLWIVEGYGDAVKMWDEGIRNVVAIGSTCLTDTPDYSHVELLKKLGITDIIIALDGDDGGRAGIAASLESLRQYTEFNVKICCFPEGDDPDSFITSKGKEEFLKLPLLTPFEYMLSLYPFDADKTKICQEMIKYIEMEKSVIIQHDMANALSKRSDIPYSVIEKEISMFHNDRDFQKHKDFMDFQVKLQKEIKRAKNMDDLFLRVDLRGKELQNMLDSHNPETLDSKTEYKKRLSALKTEFATIQKKGHSCGKFKMIEDHLDGFPSHGSMIGLAGVSNIGKTSFVRNLTWELIINNPNLLIIFMSIDDPFKKIVPAYIALSTGLSITEVSKSGLKIEDMSLKKAKLNAGWKDFDSISDRLIIKDVSDGSTTASLEKEIQYYKQLHPKMDMMVVIDNFHKLRDFPDIGGESRQRFTMISSRIKDLTTIYNIPILNVMELRKFADSNDKRPTLQDIKETVDIEYDCDLIWLFHQPLHVKHDTDMVWQYNDPDHPEWGEMTMPYNELDFAKNKESAFKGLIHLKFITHKSTFEEATKDEMDERGTRENKSPDELHSRDQHKTYSEQMSLKTPANNDDFLPI